MSGGRRRTQHLTPRTYHLRRTPPMTDNETLVRTNPFAGLLGVRFLEVTPQRLRAQVTVREDMCTVGNVLHGGALMSLADTAGAHTPAPHPPPAAPPPPPPT